MISSYFQFLWKHYYLFKLSTYHFSVVYLFREDNICYIIKAFRLSLLSSVRNNNVYATPLTAAVHKATGNQHSLIRIFTQKFTTECAQTSKSSHGTAAALIHLKELKEFHQY